MFKIQGGLIIRMALTEIFAKGKHYLERKVKRAVAWDWKEWVQGWRSYRVFKRLKVAEKTVLMVEPNTFHAEILPGFVNYFTQSGYKTILLCRRVNAESGVFCRVPESQRPMLLPMNPGTMKRCLKTGWAQRFELLFLTSSYLSEFNGFFGLFFDYLGFDPQPKSRVFMIEHHFSSIKKYLESRRFYPDQIFLLSRLENNFWPVRMLNPHYFGEIKSQLEHTEIVVFITIGTVTERNRNFGELMSAVGYLENIGVKNFVIKVVGRGADAKMLKNASQHIELLGYLDFPSMFEQVEKAHFFLPLLDPSYEGHRRYLNGETTGTRQLILGFSKVPIIHELFAASYRFNAENSIVYGESGLGKAMAQGILMQSDEYQKHIEALSRLQKDVFEESMKSLQMAIK